MLMLTRKSGEVIRIGEEIAVTVVEIRGDKVRIGVDAPRTMAVHRQEVFDKIERTGSAEPSRAVESAAETLLRRYAKWLQLEIDLSSGLRKTGLQVAQAKLASMQLARKGGL